MRRRLFENEIGINPENSDDMELLAEFLEIQTDGFESAGEFVAYALKSFEKESLARGCERRAQMYRREIE